MALFSNVTQGIARDADEVTPHDTNPNNWSYLWVGTGGNITMVTEAGSTVVITGIPSGSYVWQRTSIIKSTGTTASAIVGHK
jgi:hypothetical protein